MFRYFVLHCHKISKNLLDDDYLFNEPGQRIQYSK